MSIPPLRTEKYSSPVIEPSLRSDSTRLFFRDSLVRAESHSGCTLSDAPSTHTSRGWRLGTGDWLTAALWVSAHFSFNACKACSLSVQIEAWAKGGAIMLNRRADEIKPEIDFLMFKFFFF